jgi:hypothetical protein
MWQVYTRPTSASDFFSCVRVSDKLPKQSSGDGAKRVNSFAVLVGSGGLNRNFPYSLAKFDFIFIFNMFAKVAAKNEKKYTVILFIFHTNFTEFTSLFNFKI